MSKERVTIQDVAKAAGVSAQTVSRVLNDRPDVSSETRSRIQEIIKTLGYSPNVFARNLSRGRSNTIGVVGYGLVYFGSSSVLTGIEGKINELGFSLTLSLIDNFDPSKIERILYDFLSRRVEGIIWAVPAIDHNFDMVSEKLSEIETPIVFINKGSTESDFVSAMDNRLGSRLATQHLVEQGYRHIGIITGPSDWWEAQERLAGWREVITDEGYSNIDNLVVVGDWSAQSGEMGLLKLFDQDPEIDAVFISNDQMALGALKAARHLGLNIPDDLGIVGFDDIPEAPYFFPPLTTVRQDPRELGAMAVEWIHEIIQAQQKGASLEPGVSWSEPRLVIRKSSVREPGVGN